MLRVRLIFTIATIVLYVSICVGEANAALVKTDLIGGLGEFEFSAETAWQMATSTAWPYGVKPATPDDSVAAGWSRLTGVGVVPEQNTIYRIEPGKGLKGSNCQYFALRGTRGGICIRKVLYVADGLPSEIHHGDKLVFRIDRVFMSGYSLPKGTSVEYKMTVICNAPNSPTVSTALPISSKPFSVELETVVADNAQSITLQVEMTLSGNPGSAIPGIYIDGARLYRKSASGTGYKMEQVPAPRNRAIQTQMVFFQSGVTDPYEVARDYDAVMLQQECDYPCALRLKYYNPNIKVSLYELGGGVADWRDQSLVDSPYSNCPFTFSDVLANHVSWLYPWPVGFTPVDQRQPWLKDAYFVFEPSVPNQYYVRMDDPDYQRQWRVAATDKATRYHLDGVFVDGAGTLESSPGMPVSRDPAEVQSFLHGVSPYLHQAGLQAIVNDSVVVLNTSPANTFFDPRWKTNASYPASDGYANNTPQTTPDALFQEWGFFMHWPLDGVDMNHYDLSYWDATLGNLETVASWNKSLPVNYQKTVLILTHGVDRPEDPASGLNGWAHFALCSYMLAQNQFTWFGADRVGRYERVQMDFSGTVRLGTMKSSTRTVLTSDRSLQMRVYKNGFVIVNGHPTEPRTYMFPRRAIDENNVWIMGGTTITLQPRTGRMFFYS
jgi:hypothetical protein